MTTTRMDYHPAYERNRLRGVATADALMGIWGLKREKYAEVIAWMEYCAALDAAQVAVWSSDAYAEWCQHGDPT